MDDLVGRLRQEHIVSRDDGFTVLVDGKETLYNASVTTMRRNPDGAEAADRIEALTAQLAELERQDK